MGAVGRGGLTEEKAKMTYSGVVFQSVWDLEAICVCNGVVIVHLTGDVRVLLELPRCSLPWGPDTGPPCSESACSYPMAVTLRLEPTRSKKIENYVGFSRIRDVGYFINSRKAEKAMLCGAACEFVCF